MASLEFCDKHNMVAYLEKSKGSEGFHQIIVFLTASHIKNALTECPTLYASLIEQFWQTAALSTNEDGVKGITATIDRKVKVFVSEASIRRHLKLEDSEGLKTLPTVEIFKQLALMGFIQIFLNKRKRMLFPHKRTFPTPTLTQKLFSNMKRASKGYSGVNIPLFPNMLTTSESSLSRITSSPSLSPQTHQPPSTPQSNQTTLLLRRLLQCPMNHLSKVFTHLDVMRVVYRIDGSFQARRRAKVVISDDEEAEEDPSNQGRSLIEELDLDAGISLVPPHAVDQGRINDIQISDQPEEHLGVFSVATALADAARKRQSVENVQTYTKRRREVSTCNAGVSTASRLVSTADISTASELDSTAGVKEKDKGKAIMHESEPPKKIKKRVQVQMSVDEELAKKLDEREEVAAKVDQAHDIDWSDPAVLRYYTLQNRPFSVAEVRKNMCLYLKNQGGYKMIHFKGMRYEDIRPIFERVWDQNQAFIPMSSEIEKEVMNEESAKKWKLEDDTEKEELQVYLNIVPEDESLDVESLATKGDLDKLWSLVKERFNLPGLTDDKEKEIWIELKRLFKPDDTDTLWNLQRYMHDPLK
ncbi:hypothetical protein Tco_1439519 [Tanacetum coccineum]